MGKVFIAAEVLVLVAVSVRAVIVRKVVIPQTIADRQDSGAAAASPVLSPVPSGYRQDTTPAPSVHPISPDGNNTIHGQVELTANSLTDYFLRNGQTTTFHGTIANYSFDRPRTVRVKIEVVDTKNAVVSDRVWEPVTLVYRQSKDFSITTPPGLPPGIYFISVGIYDPDGNKLLSWFPKYQNFKVI